MKTPDNTPVLATEEAAWTVDDTEANLPPPVEERQEIQFDDHPTPPILFQEEIQPTKISFSSISEPSWEAPDAFVMSYSRSLTQAEKIVLSAPAIYPPQTWETSKIYITSRLHRYSTN